MPWVPEGMNGNGIHGHNHLPAQEYHIWQRFHKFSFSGQWALLQWLETGAGGSGKSGVVYYFLQVPINDPAQFQNCQFLQKQGMRLQL